MDVAELEAKYQACNDVDMLIELDKEYIRYLQGRLALNPMDVQALIHLGVLSWEPFHDEKKAIHYLQQAVACDPKNVEARFWMAKCYYHDFCDYAKAKAVLLEALDIDPSRSDCLSLLASISWTISNKIDKAIHYLELAVQYEPSWPFPQLFLGELYLKINQTEMAKKQVKKLQELARNPIKRPRNGVEDYYETLVTGKGYKAIDEDILALLEKIRERELKLGS